MHDDSGHALALRLAQLHPIQLGREPRNNLPVPAPPLLLPSLARKRLKPIAKPRKIPYLHYLRLELKDLRLQNGRDEAYQHIGNGRQKDSGLPPAEGLQRCENRLDADVGRKKGAVARGAARAGGLVEGLDALDFVVDELPEDGVEDGDEDGEVEPCKGGRGR